MKKLLLFNLILILSACSGGNDDNTTLNQDLVGTWYGTSVDNSPPMTSTDIELRLNANGDGYATFDSYDQDDNFIEFWDWDITWSSTTSVLTVNYFDYDLPESEQLVDTEALSYEFIDSDTLRITEDDGDITFLYRY